MKWKTIWNTFLSLTALEVVKTTLLLKEMKSMNTIFHVWIISIRLITIIFLYTTIVTSVTWVPLRLKLPADRLIVQYLVRSYDNANINESHHEWIPLRGRANNAGESSYINNKNPGYFCLAAAPKPQQIPIFLHISVWVWGHRRYTHIVIVGFYVKTAIIRQLKCPCVPGCTYMESIFIDLIHINLYIVFLLIRPFPQGWSNVHFSDWFPMILHSKK